MLLQLLPADSCSLLKLYLLLCVAGATAAAVACYDEDAVVDSVVDNQYGV